MHLRRKSHVVRRILREHPIGSQELRRVRQRVLRLTSVLGRCLRDVLSPRHDQLLGSLRRHPNRAARLRSVRDVLLPANAVRRWRLRVPGRHLGLREWMYRLARRPRQLRHLRQRVRGRKSLLRWSLPVSFGSDRLRRQLHVHRDRSVQLRRVRRRGAAPAWCATEGACVCPSGTTHCGDSLRQRSPDRSTANCGACGHDVRREVEGCSDSECARAPRGSPPAQTVAAT